MRVCHIIGSFRPVIGGAERATETLAGALHAQGEDIIVLTRRFARTDAPFEVISGVPVHRLGLPGRSKLHALTFGLVAIFRLSSSLRSYRIVHVQDIDTSMIVGMVVRRLPRRRLVATLHGETALLGRTHTRTGRLRIRATVRSADRITSINPENTRQLVRAGVAPTNIREIPNGIEGSRFRPVEGRERAIARGTLGLPEHAFVALYLGRLQPYKRVDLLIDAWKRLPLNGECHLVIVGVGPDETRLREQAAGIGSIRFDGPTDDAVTYLRAADIFVNPSGDPKTQWYEGLSVALLEAAFVGVLPIVTVSPGNDVIVKDGVTGLAFPVGDRDGLMACLTVAIEDPELRLRLGRQAHDAVVDTYSAAAVARQVAAMYREISD